MEVDGCGYGLGWGGVEWMTTLERGRGVRGHCRESKGGGWMGIWSCGCGY